LLNAAVLAGSVENARAEMHVVSVSTWQYEKNKFIKLIDPRCTLSAGARGAGLLLTVTATSIK
jgi:hypothetical protein